MKITLTAIRNFMNAAAEPPEIWSLKRVRNVLKGYKILKSSDDKRLVNRIVEQITESELTANRGVFSNIFFPFNTAINDRSYSQYLLINLIGTRLHASILCYLSGKSLVKAPLPKSWIDVLNKNKIGVSNQSSAILFFLFTLKKFFYGIVVYFQFLFKNFRNLLFGNEQPIVESTYFSGLIKDCLPPENGSFSYNIIEWYLSWDGRDQSVKRICHDVKKGEYNYRDHVIESADPFPLINGYVNFIKYVAWGFISIVIAFLNLLIGKYRYAIMLSEIHKAKMVLLANKNVLGKEYFFNNLNIAYRPLWTYAAEQKGAKIIYYNWAASFSDFLSPDGYKTTDLGEKLMSYPNILQWSPQYSSYLQSIYQTEWTNLEIVPPIYFSDSGNVPPKSEKPTIVVFDVTPQRRYFHDILVPFVEYRTFENGKKFLEDIYEIAMAEGYDIVWKAKRSFTSHHSKAYIKFYQKFADMPGIIIADPSTSAFRLVQNADIIVSMPFTSTSLIGNAYSVPSVYYDPFFIISKQDRGANGLPLLSGKDELRQWIKSLKHK